MVESDFKNVKIFLFSHSGSLLNIHLFISKSIINILFERKKEGLIVTLNMNMNMMTSDSKNSKISLNHVQNISCI